MAAHRHTHSRWDARCDPATGILLVLLVFGTCLAVLMALGVQLFAYR